MVSKTNLGGSLAIIPYLVNRYFSGTKIVTGVEVYCIHGDPE
jgi:hypothetical protein